MAIIRYPRHRPALAFHRRGVHCLPTLEDKVHIIENTVEVAHACGVPNPKVAPLAAVEVVNPKMPVTVEAAELTKMCEEGKITGCVVDGPLSLDLAIDRGCKTQRGNRPQNQGDADILLFPDIMPKPVLP